jgi:hypothetical protein
LFERVLDWQTASIVRQVIWLSLPYETNSYDLVYSLEVEYIFYLDRRSSVITVGP